LTRNTTVFVSNGNVNRIHEQLGKLIAMAAPKAINRGSNTSNLKQPPYHLMHSLSWDENGELHID